MTGKSHDPSRVQVTWRQLELAVPPLPFVWMITLITVALAHVRHWHKFTLETKFAMSLPEVCHESVRSAKSSPEVHHEFAASLP